MPPTIANHPQFSLRGGSTHKLSVFSILIYTLIGAIAAWIFASVVICPCFCQSHGCESKGWMACLGVLDKCINACRPKPREMGRERDLVAEDRIWEELRVWNRLRTERMVYQSQNEVTEADRNVVAVEQQEEEQLPAYEPRRESIGRERLNAEILERRRNDELAASDEREMPVEDERSSYDDDIMIAEPPPAYLEARPKTQ